MYGSHQPVSVPARPFTAVLLGLVVLGLTSGQLETDRAVRWTSRLDQTNKFETVSLAVCPDAVVAVAKFQNRNRAHPQWYLTGFLSENGQEIWFWRHELPLAPLPGGLLVGPQGQVVLAALNGTITSIGPKQPPAAR